MSLKKKLLIGLICLFPLVAILEYFNVDKRTQVASEANYRENSLTQLDLIDDYLTLFFNGYMDDVQILAQSHDLLSAENDFPNYVADNSTGDWEGKTLSPLAKKVVHSWKELATKDDYIDDIYVGFESGASYSITASEISGGFVGLARPWYIAGKMNSKRASIGTAYMSLTGDTVVPIMHKIFDTRSNFVGVLGLDISLTTVTKYLSNLNFGETGYIIVVDHNDKMLTNSRHQRNIFKFIKDVDNKAFKEFYFSDNIHANIPVNGSPSLVTKFKGKLGYTIISVIEQQEVINPEYKATHTTKIITIIFAIFIIIAAFLAIHFVKQMKD